MKAVIIYNGEHPAFTHDIGKLADHCKALGENYSDNLDDISDSLTLWESKSRYDPYISFSKKKYDKAKNIYDEIHTKLMQEIAPVYENEEAQEYDLDESDQGMTM